MERGRRWKVGVYSAIPLDSPFPISSFPHLLISFTISPSSHSMEEQKRLETLLTGLKFLLSNKGSKIILSEDDLVATKIGGSYCWTNSFVAIRFPLKGTIILTLLNFDSDLSSFIGFFDPSYLQTSNCHNHSYSLAVLIGETRFFVNGNKSGPSNTGCISRGQQIIIEFNNNQATFSVPSLDYSHTITWPSGYVFGLTMCCNNTSWELSTD
ncbi:hypothetical protein RCL1_008131 [Eukaryota sp. TZLM3-RCL]